MYIYVLLIVVRNLCLLCELAKSRYPLFQPSKKHFTVSSLNSAKKIQKCAKFETTQPLPPLNHCHHSTTATTQPAMDTCGIATVAAAQDDSFTVVFMGYAGTVDTEY